MARYVRTRLVLAVPTILLTSLVVFLMLFLIPGDPASIYVGEQTATPERLAEIRRVMGLDRPLHVQYADFLRRALHGDLGRSLQTNRPVLDESWAGFPAPSPWPAPRWRWPSSWVSGSGWPQAFATTRSWTHWRC